MARDGRCGDRLLCLRKRVVRRHRKDEWNGAKRARLYTLHWRGVRGAEQQIGAPGEQGVPRAAQDFTAEAQAGGGVLSVEILDHRQQRAKVHKVVQHDGQRGLPAGGQALDAAGQVVGGLQQMAAFVEQCAAGGREFCAVAAAVKQQHIQIILQLAHHIRERGGHLAQFMRGGGKATLAFNRVQDFQGFQRERHIQNF